MYILRHFSQPHRVHHLGSEIAFIEDLMQSKQRVGEQGHMFTTLKVLPVFRLLYRKYANDVIATYVGIP